MAIDSYLVVCVIGPVEVRRRYMMAIIPVRVRHASIISVVLDYLLLCQTESISISVLALRQVDQLVYMLATKRCLAMMRCYRWSHLTEDHCVVFRHLASRNRNLLIRSDRNFSTSINLISV